MSCGRVLGHGLSCEPDYLCDQCGRIAELEARLDAVDAYVNCLDGLPGSPMWRIKTDILAALEQKD